LLCGYPPFNGASNLDIYHAIKYSPPNFSGEEWKEVSREVIDLIKIMLNKSPQKRFSGDQCLQHKWFSKLSVSQAENKENGPKPQFNQLKAINKMSNFVMENRLKQSVLQFISTQYNLKEEERSLRQLFLEFDCEKKGYITYASFHQVLSKYFGENESKLICDKMFENLDLDGSGEISYNEFITAIIDNKSTVTNERLENTFKLFDKVKLKLYF
jgi:calcium-dependent protein kinase